MAGSSRTGRSGGPIFEVDVEFPPMKTYEPKTKLPTIKSVIGMIRFHVGRGGAGHSTDVGVREVAKLIQAKWYHDTVACKSYPTIIREVEKLRATFMNGKRRFALGEKHQNETIVKKFMELVKVKNNLFDIYQEDKEKRKLVEIEWGVTMSDNEFIYYEDQRTDRKMECSKGVDPVWYHAMMRRERMKERTAEYREQRLIQFEYKSLDKITELLDDRGEVVWSDIQVHMEGIDLGENATEEAIGTEEVADMVENVTEEDRGTEKLANLDENATEEATVTEEVVESARKKRKYAKPDDDTEDSDPLPKKYRHIRISERKVREEMYKTVANLSGKGLSLDEACNAVIDVGNGIFDRNWKKGDLEENIYDRDTMPDKRSMRGALNLIEAQSLSLVVDKMEEEKRSGRMLTHAIDSTTKKGVGQFAAQGIHIGQDSPFPLPILSIDGESTEDIAMQVDMGFEILAAVRGVKVEEVYSLIDTHITDSTEHNKGFAKVLAEIYDLETPAGQIFCGTHTTLGFSSAMNKGLRLVESEMKLETLVQSFMVDLDVDTKNSSIAGQALDMCLKLVAPELSHKPWNKNREFRQFLEKKGVTSVLFAYKDGRFGCLSRAAAVLLYHYDHLGDFLAENPHINNRLACLVREVMELPYLKVVFVVFACLGVHMVEPFYARTIKKGATHSELKKFYKTLHTSLGETASNIFISFEKPQFGGVSDKLFNAVKKSYGEDVLMSVTDVAEQHKGEVMKLTKLLLPEMRKVLARQRRDYGIDEDAFPAQYPVEEQADNIDDTPVHNIGMERQCGKIDYRLHKLGTLESVSMAIILQRSEDLRSGKTPSFRGFKAAAMAKKELQLFWSDQMKKRFSEGADEKQEMALKQERKRLTMLEILKTSGGPFTAAEEVSIFIDDSDVDSKTKQKRMKLEIQFARESTTLLPKVDPLFRIQKTLPGGKRCDKTGEEFAEALMAYLGKKGDRLGLEYNRFQECLDKLVD